MINRVTDTPRFTRMLVAWAGITTILLPILFGAIRELHASAEFLPEVTMFSVSPVTETESQEATRIRRKFEVASVKPNNSGAVPSALPPSGNRFVATNLSLKALIRMAYGVQEFQIAGGPAWADSDGFDIAAAAESEFSSEDLEAMLQSLLADRFQLRVVRQTREMPVYELSVDPKGHKLLVSRGGTDAQATTVSSGSGRMNGTNAAISQWLGPLSVQVGRKVIDKTGLTGNFDFRMEWTPESAPGSAPGAAQSGSSIHTAIQEQLGLRLNSATGPVEVLVIESVEKPAAN